jgi:hypothetical protein
VTPGLCARTISCETREGVRLFHSWGLCLDHGAREQFASVKKSKAADKIALPDPPQRHQATEHLIGYDKDGLRARVSDFELSGSVSPVAKQYQSLTPLYEIHRKITYLICC